MCTAFSMSSAFLISSYTFPSTPFHILLFFAIKLSPLFLFIPFHLFPPYFPSLPFLSLLFISSILSPLFLFIPFCSFPPYRYFFLYSLSYPSVNFPHTSPLLLFMPFRSFLSYFPPYSCSTLLIISFIFPLYSFPCPSVHFHHPFPLFLFNTHPFISLHTKICEILYLNSLIVSQCTSYHANQKS
jgi:hypothetical protein